jgi:hypothetical protein
VTITAAVADQLRGKAVSLRALMGSDVDARKIVSSLTLFGHVAKGLHAKEGGDAYQSLARAAGEILAAAALEGYPPCVSTLGRLNAPR